MHNSKWLKVCKFRTDYYDSESRVFKRFHCEEKALPTGHCIFHDKNYHLEHPNTVVRLLLKKITLSISNNSVLYCIGYHIPYLRINFRFPKPVYFNRAQFYGFVQFFDTEFNDKTSFFSANFRGIVEFSAVTFHDSVDFSSTKFKDVKFYEVNFNGDASFWSTYFVRHASFNFCRFKKEVTFSDQSFSSSVDFSNTDFYDAWFSRIIFQKEAYFNEVHFHNAFFIETEFGRAVQFPKSIFDGSSNFSNTKFNGKADFSKSEFNGKADFSKSIINETAELNFSGSIFNGGIEFSGISCKGTLIFFLATFNDKASFRQAKLNEVKFNGSNFNKLADFVYTEFYSANFSEVYFLDEAWFGGTHFLRDANFSRCVFKQKVYFYFATFKEANFFNSLFTENAIADFSQSTFQDESYFSSVIFYDMVDFSQATFGDKSDFSYTKFTNARFFLTCFQECQFVGAEFKKAEFIKSQFHGSADFSIARFGEAYFYDIKIFEKKVNFSGSRFQIAYFYKTVFNNDVNFYQSVLQAAQFSETVFNGKTDFSYSLFGDGDKILFDVTDFSNVSFMNTDLSRVRFGENVRWGKSNNYKIIDEARLEELINSNPINKDFQSVRLGGIVTIYRNLRENYEYSLRYEEADRFFTREMDLKRKFRERFVHGKYVIELNDWFRRNLSLTGLYYWISEYGQNYKRPALLALAFIALPILYSLIQQSLTGANLTLERISNTTEASLRNILQIEKGKDIVGYIIGVVTLPAIGILLVAGLKRTFEKKFRHS